MYSITQSPFFAQDAYINGEWIKGQDTYPVINPATGEVIANMTRSGSEHTQAAIDAARVAFASLKKTLAKERSTWLKKIGVLLMENQKELASIITTEQGKPLAEAMGEIAYAASYYEWFAEEAKRINGDIIPSNKPNSRILLTKEPVGVVAAITPWNFPLAMFARKMAAAIAAGCTVVWKPSEETPLSATALAKISDMAGLPKGVLNIVSGNVAEIGQAIMASDDVRKITFTGSTRTGKLLLKQAAETVKKVSMELGGNAPFIVFPDANIDAAVEGAMAAKFRNAGQTCVCVNRFYIHADVYDEFVSKLTLATKNLVVAQGFETNATQGPLINQAALTKVESHVQDALSKGGQILCGGKRHSLGHTFYEPTIIANANLDMLISTEETFGPIAACFKFTDEAEAIRLANQTEYGLSAYFYSRDLAQVFRVAEALEVGMVGVNDGIISTEIAPFGGVKESGMGREGSSYGIDEYVNIKYVLLGGL